MFKGFFFDYFYYRLYKANRNNEDKGFPAVVVISGIQFLFTAGVFSSLARIFVSRQVTAPYAKSIAVIGVVLLLGLLFYNNKKYAGKFDELNSKWCSENGWEKIVKGVMIAVAIILSFSPLLIIGIFF